MNKITIFLVVIIVALSFSLGTTIQSNAAVKKYLGVIPFVTSSDRVGFFDQNNGKIYMYDSSVNQCLFVGQIQNLGAAIQTISANLGSTNL